MQYLGVEGEREKVAPILPRNECRVPCNKRASSATHSLLPPTSPVLTGMENLAPVWSHCSSLMAAIMP